MRILKKILKITILSIILIILIQIKSYSNNTNTINEQQESFGISDFVKETKQYQGEFFEGVDINKILNDAIQGKVDNSTIYKKILKILGKEVQTTIITIVSILAVILIHSILKAITEGLQNESIAKLVYYVQYILIVTIIMLNISDIVNLVQDTCINLVRIYEYVSTYFNNINAIYRKYNN